MTIYTKRQLTSFIFWLVIIIAILILFFASVRALAYTIPDPCELEVVVCDEETITIERAVTAYTASADETDNEPCIAARNYNICENKTKKVVATNEYPKIMYQKTYAQINPKSLWRVKTLGAAQEIPHKNKKNIFTKLIEKLENMIIDKDILSDGIRDLREGRGQQNI